MRVILNNKKLLGAILIISACLLYYSRRKTGNEIEQLKEQIYRLERLNVQRSLHEQTIYDVIRQRENHLRLPGTVDLYPHLTSIRDISEIEPQYRYPQVSQGQVKMVIGIPAVDRRNLSYLDDTLEMLISRSSKSDHAHIRFVVMVSHENGTNAPFVEKTTSLLKGRFGNELDSGLIQIIVPPPAWYPLDLHSIPPTLNDNQERMTWRTKQNLDFAYLMSYCVGLGEYYLQLEDDIVTVQDYTAMMFKFIEQQKDSPWVMLEFSGLGCIGKLIKTVDIPQITAYILLNYRYKPIDWVLNDFFTNRYCGPEMLPKKCNREIRKIKRQSRPSLFQHVGLYSSLPGKMQKLKDKAFKKEKQGKDNDRVGEIEELKANPPAEIKSSLSFYKRFSVSETYEGKTMSWAMNPKKDDYISIKITESAIINKIVINTGSEEHHDDIFTGETAVLVKYDKDKSFAPCGYFDDRGNFELLLSSPTVVTEVRIEIQKDIPHWVIIRELHLFIQP